MIERKFAARRTKHGPAQFYCGKWRLINPSRQFVLSVVAQVDHIMREVTGKGCRLNSLKNTGRGDDRRSDKLGAAGQTPKAFRQYRRRYA